MLSYRPVGGSNAPFKTPGRSRAGPLPSTLLKENASRQPFLTQTGKQNRVAYPYTPNPKQIAISNIDEDRILATAKKPGTSFIAPKMTGLIDRTNRTPFPSKSQFPVTPIPSGKLQLGATPRLSLEEEPASVLRPSSTRKSLRGPRSSSRSAFETPDPRGRRPHWDVSDPDLSVELASTSTRLEGIAIVEEDDDEVEYMPPSVPESPYDPGFDLPDYAALGTAIMDFARRPVLGSRWTLDSRSEKMPEYVEEGFHRSPRDRDDDSPFPRRMPVAGVAAKRPTAVAPMSRVPSTAARPHSTAASKPTTRTNPKALPFQAPLNPPKTRTLAIAPRPTLTVRKPELGKLAVPPSSSRTKTPVTSRAVSRSTTVVSGRTVPPRGKTATSPIASELLQLGKDVGPDDLLFGTDDVLL